MRIVHVVRQFHPAIGGIENVVGDLASIQLRKGHSVRVVTLDRVFDRGKTDRLPPREVLGGIEVVRIPFVGSRRYPIAPSVLRHIGKADIVHVHGLDFFFDFLAVTAPLHRRRLVVSTHGAFFHTPYAAALKRIYFSTVTRFSLSRYAGVATVSAADDRLFRALRTSGVWLIENGVDIRKYADAGSREPHKTLIAVGRFSSNKRLEQAIRFVAALRGRDPQWRLKIVGRPWDVGAAELTAFAAEQGVAEAVDVLSAPADGAIREAMGACSAIVSASEYEGFGLAAVEGLSAGLYPVLSDIPPFRRLVETSGLGLLLDFSRPQDAAARFLEKWEEVARDYRRLRQAAIEAAAGYGWERVGEKYEALYHSVLGTRARAILDVNIEVSTFEEAAAFLDERIGRRERTIVTFANAHTLNRLRSEKRAQSLGRNLVLFNDGIGVDIASWLLFGKRFPENLNGTDFVPRYLRHTRHPLRIFLLGAKAGVAERAAARFAADFPQHTIGGCRDGYFGPGEVGRVVADIRNSRADLLLAAMGNLEQELWLAEHLADTGCTLGFGVGGLFDFVAGVVPRAPSWVRALHMEWLYRMLQEPRRLWRRYLVGMPIFLFRVMRQWLAGARATGVPQE